MAPPSPVRDVPALPPEFLGPPLAHRGLHDKDRGRPENSRAAVLAAIEAGYGIELDLQLTQDSAAMVFHDYDLARLTGAPGSIRGIDAEEAATLPLLHGDGETVPHLAEVLELVAGRVPLLLEIKDQDGAMGPSVGELEAATARAIRDYRGPLAVMSFNPHSVEEMARLAPEVPRGLVTCGYDAQHWNLPAETRDRLRAIPDFDRVAAGFVSHRASDLARPRVREIRAAGTPVLCWTIRSAAEEADARQLCDNVTFEGYLPPIPA